MPQCPSCGVDNADGLKFCGSCGASLASICPNCAFANPPAFRFCGDCGTPLGAGRARATPASPAERRQLTVVFCDLADSTALAERLDPEELREVIQEYQAAASARFTTLGGHVAQHLGDGLLVYFGYPRAHEDDPRRAVHASLDVVDAVRALGARLRSERDFGLAVRIGIHTGAVVAGDIGTGQTRERLALGATPNIAARLQALAAPDSVIVSEATHGFVDRWFACRPLGAQSLKGVTRQVLAYEVSGPRTEGGWFELDGARSLSTLVGRQEEMALLLRHLAATRHGTGQLVLLSGEAGVGKSRLVHSVRHRADDQGFRCLLGRCASVYQSSPLHPVADLVERALGLTADDTPAARLDKLERGLAPLGRSLPDDVPLLAALLGIDAGPRYPAASMLPHRQKGRLFELLLALLHALARSQPTLLVLEDVHWADPSTLEFLTVFASQPPSPGLLSLVTVRHDFALPWQSRASVTRVTLQRLRDEDIARLVDELLGDESVPGAVRLQVVAKADGIPVFAEELSRMLAEAGRTERPGSGGPLPALAIPATLQDSLLARLDHMDDAKDVAQLAAVIGREFSFELLLAVSGLGERELERQLGQLVGAEVLYQRGVAPHATYLFKHALIQDAAYELLLRTTRRVVHQRVAETYAGHFPQVAASHPELVAHHLTEAGLAAPAIAAWVGAGLMALRRSANQEAILQLQRGLALLPAIPEGMERDRMELALLTTIGPAYSATRSYGSRESRETYSRACELCERIGDAPELFWAVRGLWVNYHCRAELDTALEIARRCERIAALTAVPEIMMEAQWALGNTLLFRGELREAQRAFDRLLSLDHPARDRTNILYTAFDIVTAAESLYAQLAWLLGDTDAAREHGRRAVQTARDGDQPLSLTLALYHAGWVEHVSRDSVATRQLMREVIRLCDENGMVLEPPARMITARLDEDAVAFAAAFDIQCATGTEVGLTYMLGALAEIHLARRQPDEARLAIERALSLGEAHGEHLWDAELHRLLGEVALASPAAAAMPAERLFRRALAIADRQGAGALAARARASLATLGARGGAPAVARR